MKLALLVLALAPLAAAASSCANSRFKYTARNMETGSKIRVRGKLDRRSEC